MEKQEPKKTWVTPELIILVRSMPEEAVLTVCKGGSNSGTAGANSAWSGCVVVEPCANGCFGMAPS
jgi:hypothetical protein